MTSCGGHLARVDLSMYYSSANTCQNQIKLCTLKVQDDVQLAKFACQSKIVRSQASFNDSTISGLGPKILAKADQNFKTAMRKSVLPSGSKIPIDSDE